MKSDKAEHLYKGVLFLCALTVQKYLSYDIERECHIMEYIVCDVIFRINGQPKED